MTEQNYRAPETISRLERRALVVAILGLFVCLVGYLRAPGALLRSYLFAYMFVLGLSLGSLGLLMLQHLTGGHWGIVIRRPLESATRSLPLLTVLFIPIVL